MARKDFARALKGGEELRITVIGRLSARKITLPVWFVQDGEVLYLLPVKGASTLWYRNLLKNRLLGLATKQEKWHTNRLTLIRDRARVRRIADRFRAKYGAGDVRRYYSRFDAAVRIQLG